jgi:hypothetical protein
LADFFLVDFFLADFFQVRKLLTILLIRWNHCTYFFYVHRY